MTSCPECGGDVVTAFELRNGDVVSVDDVSFEPHAAPSCVVPVDVCRSCGWSA